MADGSGRIDVKIRAAVKIDTSGWRHVSLKPWHKDRRYTEVWVSQDGKHWSMLGMRGPRDGT